jgi:hypothetical protein
MSEFGKDDAKNVAKANLDWLARSLGDSDAWVGEPGQAEDGSWIVLGEIYKGSYDVTITFYEGGEHKPVYSVVVSSAD